MRKLFSYFKTKRALIRELEMLRKELTDTRLEVVALKQKLPAEMQVDWVAVAAALKSVGFGLPVPFVKGLGIVALELLAREATKLISK